MARTRSKRVVEANLGLCFSTVALDAVDLLLCERHAAQSRREFEKKAGRCLRKAPRAKFKNANMKFGIWGRFQESICRFV